MDQVVETVWNTLNPTLQQFIRRRVPDTPTADDLLQEVYLKVHTNVDSLRDPARMESWVYQIARHVITDYYRAQKPQAEIPRECSQVGHLVDKPRHLPRHLPHFQVLKPFDLQPFSQSSVSNLQFSICNPQSFIVNHAP